MGREGEVAGPGSYNTCPQDPAEKNGEKMPRMGEGGILGLEPPFQ